MKTLGAVLTGGQSIRMGKDKADIDIDGRTMLDRCADVISELVDDVVLMGPDRDGYTCWPDAVHGSGPLAGIATALNRYEGDQVVAIAVDQPFVRVETLRNMMDRAGPVPVVPVDDDGIRQVTCAVYPTATAAAAMIEASAGGSIQSYLDAVSFDPVPPDVWTTWGEDGRSWFSVDTPNAVTEAIERFNR